jgi:hypothetical protein
MGNEISDNGMIDVPPQDDAHIDYYSLTVGFEILPLICFQELKYVKDKFLQVENQILWEFPKGLFGNPFKQ